ncbi:preprotein translocase subunit SecE [candidate division WWE3 bacterium]|nr:preprotein translocase subunit SecE [candidate division WWE3 bacterium]
MQKVFDYIKEAIEELKRVQWPTKKQTIRLTVLVIGVSVGVGLYVSGLDYVFAKTIELMLSQK